MALTTTRMDERRVVGGQEAQLRSAARRMERAGYSGNDFRQAAEMVRLQRGSNINSADADIRANRLRTQMDENMIAEGRRARGLTATGEPATRASTSAVTQTLMTPDTQVSPVTPVATTTPQGPLTTMENDLDGIPDLTDNPPVVPPVSFAEQERIGRERLNREGAFGGVARITQARRDNAARINLFNEMRGANATGRSSEFRERARRLGVTDEQWSNTIRRLG